MFGFVVNQNNIGEQFVIELKIWSGQKYNEDGEKQVKLGDKIIVEAVV